MRLFTVIILKNYIIRFDDENGLNLFLFIDDYFKWIKIIIRICIRIFSLFYRFDVEALNNDLSNFIQIENSVKKKRIINPNRHYISKEFRSIHKMWDIIQQIDHYKYKPFFLSINTPYLLYLSNMPLINILNKNRWWWTSLTNITMDLIKILFESFTIKVCKSFRSKV